MMNTNFAVAAVSGATLLTRNKVALIGTYAPQKCGIATFTEDLRAALGAADARVAPLICAVRPPDSSVEYSDAVALVVDRDDPRSYDAAADRLNRCGVDVISLQHEFGIFGGRAGDCILRLLDRATASVVTTLHTISPKLDRDQRRVTEALIDRSDRIVTMARKGREILVDGYGADPSQIDVVPHGVPALPASDKEAMKSALGFAGREVLMTFGLLGRGKGLETMVRAMPAIAAQHPDALYVILGATHPAVRRSEGEAYREMLQTLAAELGVERNVAFINSYVTACELVEYLSAADIYVTPYLNEAQITSGTLSYAYALGVPVISTPYWHAAELLAGGRGVLRAFGDNEGFAEAAIALLDDPEIRHRMARRAVAHADAMRWPEVGRRYLEIFAAVRRHAPSVVDAFAARPSQGSRHDARPARAAGAVA